MANVVDLREDPRIDMQMSQNIGQGIGMGIQAYRRSKKEAFIVSALQKSAVEGWDSYQLRDYLLENSKKLDESIRNELLQQELGIGGYDPLTQQYKKAQTKWYKARAKTSTAPDMTDYGRHQTAANKAREALLLSIDESEKQRLQETIDIHEHQMRLIENQLPQPPETGIPTPTEKVDAVTMAAPVTGRPPTGKAGAPSNIIGPTAPTDLGQYSPPGVQSKWTSLTPQQRRQMMFAPTEGATMEDYADKAHQFIEPADAEIEKELTMAQSSPGGEMPTQTEPPSQEYFEQMVRHIAQTDRAAAKAYYERWAPKWQ